MTNHLRDAEEPERDRLVLRAASRLRYRKLGGGVGLQQETNDALPPAPRGVVERGLKGSIIAPLRHMGVRAGGEQPLHEGVEVGLARLVQRSVTPVVCLLEVHASVHEHGRNPQVYPGRLLHSDLKRCRVPQALPFRVFRKTRVSHPMPFLIDDSTQRVQRVHVSTDRLQAANLQAHIFDAARKRVAPNGWVEHVVHDDLRIVVHYIVRMGP